MSYDAGFEPATFGRPDGNSMEAHPEHAIVIVWLLVLGRTRWPMLVTVLQNFRDGVLALPPERLVRDTAKAILIDLQRAGIVEVSSNGWQLTDYGREWCDTWQVPGSTFAMRVAAAREFTSR